LKRYSNPTVFYYSNPEIKEQSEWGFIIRHPVFFSGRSAVSVLDLPYLFSDGVRNEALRFEQ
jgi:hypothetical protein